MCSFDVSLLFTNLPLDETIQICLDKLYALAKPPKLPRSVLKDLLVFSTKRRHFVSLWWPVLRPDRWCRHEISFRTGFANIFMCDFEEKWVMNNGARPTIWFRYVDDTFTLFKNPNTHLFYIGILFFGQEWIISFSCWTFLDHISYLFDVWKV